MAWLWKKSRGHAETITYHDGCDVEVGEDEFVASIDTIASLLWTRFHRRSFLSGPGQTDRFNNFYEGVREAVRRLCQEEVDGVPLLTHLGPARLDKPGKASDLFGQRWTMKGSVVDRALDSLLECGDPEVLFYEDIKGLRKEMNLWNKNEDQGYNRQSHHRVPLRDNNYVQEWTGETDIINVARVYDALTAWDFQIQNRLVEAAAKTGALYWRERPVLFLKWQRGKAQGRGWGSLHLTVGAWARGQATSSNRRELACAVPFLVADIDGDDLDDSLWVARSLLDRLVELGVDPEDLTISYTGGRGFHIRIPHGLVGRPLWPRAGDVKPVLTRFFERLCDGLEGPEGPLVTSLDSGLFSPQHLVRAIGSEYEKNPDRRCVAYRGDEFLDLVAQHGFCALDLIEAKSASPKPPPFAFPSPNHPASVPALEAMLRAAIRDIRDRAESRWAAGTRRESRGIIEAIRLGVQPAEEFAPGHGGRSRAALLYADYLLTHGRLSERAAWAELERWNAEANPVPLGKREGDVTSELEHAFERACRYIASSRHNGIEAASSVS